MRWLAGLSVMCTVLTACGSPRESGLRGGDPARYLLRLDQLPSADFSVYTAAHAMDAVAIAGSNAALLHQLGRDGFQAAGEVRYARTVDFATSNGPIDVISTTERFASAGGAADAYRRDVSARDASGETAMSTGPLGDAAHADAVVRDTPGGVQAVQITIEWRVANLLNVLVVRGRYGGARLNDALTLAHRQTNNERS